MGYNQVFGQVNGLLGYIEFFFIFFFFNSIRFQP